MFALFSCCMHRRDASEDESPASPTERTHLIPAAPEAVPTSPTLDVQAAVQERLRERMGNIVKNKEGKMVNLSARLPFNLHNQRLAVRIDPSSSISSYTHNTQNHAATSSASSSSRSLSSSTQPHLKRTSAPVQAHVGGPLTMGADLSRSSSGASRSASRSLHDADESSPADTPPGAEDGESDRSRSLRSPPHGVRLVRGPPLHSLTPIKTKSSSSSSAAAGAGYSARRGRAKRKALGGTPLAASPGVLDAGNDRSEEEVNTPTGAGHFVVGEGGSGSGSGEGEGTPRAGTDVRQPEGHPTLSISPASTASSASSGFHVQDTGPLVVEWD